MSSQHLDTHKEEAESFVVSEQFESARRELRQSEILARINEDRESAANEFACDIVASEVQDDFTNMNELSTAQKKLLRSSILSASAVKAMDDVEATKRACMSERMISIVIFMAVILLSSVEGLIRDFTFYSEAFDTEGKKHIVKFCPYPVPLGALISHIISALGCGLFVIIKQKSEGFFQIFKWRELFTYSAYILGFAVSELATKVAETKGDPSYVKAIGQSKLLFAAIFGYFITKTRLNATQWAIVLAVTTSLFTATFVKMDQKAGIRSSSPTQMDTKLFIMIALCCVGSYILATICGLMTERAFKRDTGSFIVSYTRSRIGHIFWSVIICGLYAVFGLVNDTESWRAIRPRHMPLIILSSIYAFLITSIVKRLDSLWKAFASAATVVFTPVFLLLSPIKNNIGLSILANNLTIGICVMGFAFSKKEHAKYLQLTADINELILNQSKV